jgi:preprotein translocase subunit SecY
LLTAFGRAFRTPDLRNKMLFTLAILALFRLGSTIPAPGVDYQNVHTCIQLSKNSSVLQLVNLFSGGALLQLTIFALGIMPYITSSIIIQLLVVVIPRLERLKEQGQSGQAKLTQYTRYLTVALAVLQATGIVALARSGRLLNCSESLLFSTSVFRVTTLVLTMTAGTAVIMWLGELITDRGIGNGMSLLIFTSIAARFPGQGSQILQSRGVATFIVVILAGIGIIVGIVFMEQGQRRIPVQYAKRMIGRRMYGGTSTYIPLKVNQAGVIPVIFASSLLYLPQLLGQIWTSNPGFTNFVDRYLSASNSASWSYILLYAVLVIFFTYFYVAITFNPVEVSDNMRKYGGFIPGIRPGRPTAEYLEYVLSRITLPGALYLTAVSVLPILALHFLPGSASGANQSFPFGGTSVLILVGVGLDTTKQIESQLMLRNYEGFLK